MMESPLKPAFLSPELQTALDETNPAILGFQETRDRISNDIKSLERYLQQAAVTVEYRYSLGMCLAELEDESLPLEAALEWTGTAAGSLEEEVLFWGPDATGRFRLQREVHRWKGYVDVDVPGGPYFPDDSTHECEARPLIECKFDVRKKLYGRLPDFIRGLGGELAVERPTDFEALKGLWDLTP